MKQHLLRDIWENRLGTVSDKCHRVYYILSYLGVLRALYLTLINFVPYKTL